MLGPEHESTLGTIRNLRVCYFTQGKIAEAEALYLQELKLYGPDAQQNEIFFGLMNDLGVLYSKQGRFAEAEAKYQQALEGYQTVLGPEHERTLRTLDDLMLCYEDQGKIAETDALSQEWSA